MSKLWFSLTNGERYQTIAVIAGCLLIIYYVGCQPKGQSILNPNEKVSQSELQTEIEIVQQRIESSNLTIEQQQQVLDFLFDQALIVAAGGAVNPVAILTGAAAIFGIGATVDNVRKRKEIKTLKGS